jgi:hypothetical protein
MTRDAWRAVTRSVWMHPYRIYTSAKFRINIIILFPNIFIEIVIAFGQIINMDLILNLTTLYLNNYRCLNDEPPFIWKLSNHNQLMTMHFRKQIKETCIDIGTKRFLLLNLLPKIHIPYILVMHYMRNNIAMISIEHCKVICFYKTNNVISLYFKFLM